MADHLCPNGHTSSADDWCDTCGAPINPTNTTPANSGSGLSADSAAILSGPTRACSNCTEENPADAMFCEVCGFDFTTGELPPPTPLTPPTAPTPTAAVWPQPAGVEWVVEVWIDPDWYETRRTADTAPCPTPGMPKVVAVATTGAVVGRESSSVHPDVTCGGDPGVSRRHSRLSFDNSRWYVEDLGSTNGTFIGTSTGQTPDVPIVAGHRVELSDASRVYVGAWTRLVVRAATETERNGTI